MKKKTVLSLLATLTLATTLGSSQLAHARGTTGMDGFALQASQAGCFSHANGSLTRSGGASCTAAIWIWPLIIDSGNGTKSATIVGRGIDTVCHLVGVDRWGISTTDVFFPGFGSNNTFSEQSVSVPVPAAGEMYAYCSFGSGGQISSIRW